MANSFLSPTIVTNEALRVLHNNLTFAKGVNRAYDNSFGNSGASVSGKIGPSLRIRKPNRFSVSSGSALDIQDTNEEYVTLTVSTRSQVAFKFSSDDLTLTIDQFSDRYLKPAGLALASKIDRDGLTLASQTVYNSVGTPGTSPNAALTYLNAGVLLDDNACPRDDMRYACLNPAAQASTVNALTGLFQKADSIGQQYEKGEMGTALGFVFKMDQNVNSITTGTACDDVGMKINSSSQSGASLLIDATTGQTFNTGEVFTIADVYAVNPESFQSTGELQQFVITADATAADSKVTLSISPSIYATTSSSGKQTVTALPADDAAITMYDTTASTARPQNIAYHKDAFTLVTTDLMLPNGVDFAARKVYDGISLRVIRDYSINSDEMPCRLDVLSGWKELYPQHAVKIWG